MKIAFIDLDTSHPRRYLPILRGMGHEVTGVFDSGDVHPSGYARSFAEEHEVERVFASLDEAAALADGAFIMGCDWDRHLERMRPFIEQGKAVFVDKPIAGSFPDLAVLSSWVEAGARIAGGSALRYVPEISDFLKVPAAERGELHTMFCGCAVDEFNYGIHAFSLALGYLNSRVRKVRFLGQNVQKQVEMVCENGCRVFLSIGSQKASLPFHASLVTDRKVSHVVVDNARIYEATLAAVMPYLAGHDDKPPLPFESLIEAEKCALLALNSEEAQGDWQFLDSDFGPRSYSGHAFCEGYRQSRYPQSVPKAVSVEIN